MAKNPIIKVKLRGRYRRCELLRVYRDGAVDVRVLYEEQAWGMESIFRHVDIKNVRSADRGVCVFVDDKKGKP